MRRNLTFSALLAILLGTTMTMLCSADEGMWLFSNPPRKLLKERYNFEPTQEWLNHLQQSAVRFNSGGSGSFVSSKGLVMTNHHVGADTLAKLSSAEHDYLTDGFYARRHDEELPALDLELNVLESTEDVTDRVLAVVKPGMSGSESEKARRAVMNTIEKESLDKTDLRSDVVTLFQGGQYQLYRYKKYTDVRLVFAPDKEIAFFGGDPDNFEYPRWCLDVCFFRAYENGKPAEIKNYLPWSKQGAEENELVFVAGNPGKTDRLNTVAHLEFLRDRVFPSTLNTLRRREVLLSNFGDKSLENARRAEDELFGIQNSRKARAGGLAGLQNPAIMEAKIIAEKNFRDQIANDPKLKESSDVWQEIENAVHAWERMYVNHGLLERGAAFNSTLFSIARDLVRLADESEKPNAERLREYNESGLESLKQELFSEAPIYDDLETVKLSDSLAMYLEWVGARSQQEQANHPASDRAQADTSGWKLLNQVLDGKSPQERGADLISRTKLRDVAERKRLFEGGRAAIEASADPMIKLARLVDPRSRELRKSFEAEVEEPLRQGYAKISTAKFALDGASQYPDATFTLRLAFGTVNGYQQQGRPIPPWTEIGGLYTHAKAHGDVYPFKVPKLWVERKDQLDLETPFNFVCTADIIGGNSGSPVVNRKGEVVGLIFDGNIQSLVLDFAYNEEQARAVSVHSAGIIESLKKVYQADGLVKELAGEENR